MFKKALSLVLSLMLIITSLSVTALSVNAADDIKYVVAGTANLCDEKWAFTEESGNIMTEKEDGTYELVFSPAEAIGIAQIKVAKLTNGSVASDDDYYGDETGNNITFRVTNGGDVTVNFDPSTKKITVTGDYVEMVSELKVDSMRTVGAGDGNWLNNAAWDPADDSNLMTETSKGVYEITYNDIDAYDNYLFKFAANGEWTDSWGGDFSSTTAVYNGENITLEVPEDGSTVKLVLDLTNFNYATKTGATYKVFVNGVQANGEQKPTAPVEPTTAESQETTVAPTTVPETTVAPETTAAPLTGLNVKATSNFFPEYTQKLSADTKTVTVRYMLNSKKRMLNSQWILRYDPDVLSFNDKLNVDEDENWTFMPQAPDAVCNP
ncbi:MAG: hypothetical protein Q4A46_06905, partial [Clostridia bacterium]|nr:hypothetical protein [Clostridia bacterium]